eukprot:jgi/Ulvmu1/7548/UM037_0092.1
MPSSVDSKIPSVASIVDFLHLVQKLKTQPRKGWVLRNVQKPESIADHMYRMSVLALTMAGSEDVDQARLVKMAIVHDIAEAIVGDITPVCGVSENEKHQRELNAILHIQQILGAETAVAEEVVALWNEYESGASAEAKLCKDFDKIEMIMQAYEYEVDQPLDLQEFFDSTAGKWRTALGRALAEEIVRRRTQADK